MNSTLRRWWPLLFAAAALLLFALAVGCQKKTEQQPKTAEGQPAGPTAQLPSEMVDVLHGKPPEGGAPQMPGAQGMQGMPPAGMAGGMPGGMPGMAGGMGKVNHQVIVPEAIKKGWKAVVLQVSETGGAAKDYKVPVGGQTAIAGTSLTVKVEAFLPNFKMGPEGITSVSNEPRNPAAQVVVTERGKEIFKGWLFKMFPEAHPFRHPKYQMVLKDWVAA